MRSMNLGEKIMDFAPDMKKENPRNSEGAFIDLDDGRIMFAYSRFKGESHRDSAKSDIAIVFSSDGGKTFTDEKVILTCEGDGGVNMMSLSLLKMENGDIGLFYLVRTNYVLLQMFLRRSSDNGETWGERVLCTNQQGFFVVNNDRVRRLNSGRIIIPAASHRRGWEKDYNDGSTEEGNYFDSYAETMFFYSDDDGKTWEKAPGKCVIPNSMYFASGLQEPGLIELHPGVLWGWARTDLGRQYEFFSFDNGAHWTACEPSRFTSPNSPLSMKKHKGKIYAIWNPIPWYNGRPRELDRFIGGRTPLVIAESSDNGQTFTDPVAFEIDQESGYCYTAIHFSHDHMLLAYCAGSVDDGSCLTRLRIRRIPLEQLKDLDNGNRLEKY